jgi:hypothetical protein
VVVASLVPACATTIQAHAWVSYTVLEVKILQMLKFANARNRQNEENLILLKDPLYTLHKVCK